MNIAMLADRLIHSLYLTLIHSLWQGLLLAVLTGGIMAVTRKASATRRYNLLTGALLLFTAGGIVTFTVTWLSLGASAASALPAATAIDVSVVSPFTISAEPESFMAGLLRFLNAHSGHIVAIWFALVCIKSVQLVMGLGNLQRLKKSAVPLSGDSWGAHLMTLAASMRLTRPVRLAESILVQTPVVLGHLKPLILVPAGLLAVLPPAELEAILIHELAHIRRRDYLVNILQSLAEIVYCFNPAIWWLSALIRSEREHCCDDIAVQQTGSRKQYISALVACEEYGQPAPILAMALKGGRDSLTTRVKRIISNKNNPLNIMEKSVLATCLVAAGILLAAFSTKTVAESPQKTQREMPGTPAAPDAPATSTKMPEVPQPDHMDPKYPAPVRVMPAERTEMPAPPEPAVAPAPPAPSPVMVVPAASYGNPDDEPGLQSAEQAEQGVVSAERQEELKRLLNELAHELEVLQQEQDHDKRREELAMQRVQRAEKRAVMAQEKARRRADEARVRADEARRRGEEARREGEEKRRQAEERRRRDESGTNALMVEMVRDGIISDKAGNVEFQLSNKGFKVNGVKQPEPVFRKYKELYLKHRDKHSDNWSISYKHSVSSNLKAVPMYRFLEQDACNYLSLATSPRTHYLFV